MKFKQIEFDDINTQRIYNNYIKTVETAVAPLSDDDKLDILMEINSHIYENIQRKTADTEIDCLLNAIDSLGTPEEVLKPLIADRMLDKATRTFNPLDVAKALVFNLANGISYIVFAFLYLFLFTFIILIGAKVVNPNVGMIFKDGKFQALGLAIGPDYYEVLGNWFIPVMILCTLILYFFITLLLKFKNSFSKTKTMKSVITTIVLLFAFQISFAQSDKYTKLDSFFTILEDNNRFFGSVAVSKSDEIIYSKAIGYADIKANITNTNETKFRIGSITKTFTATLIMKAVEMGRINLDDTIDEYFSGVKNADKITVRYLLNHRSGINNFTDKEFLTWYTKPMKQSDLLDKIISKGIDFEPNEKYSYSNSNYVLLTFILEDIFNKPFPQILEQYITKPLNLSHTRYGGKINSSESEAFSYRMDTDWALVPEGDMSIPLGAGGIISTPSDLCLFAKGLFSGKLLSTKSLEQMKPVGDEEYGFAIYETQFNDLNGWGHGGNIDAFSSTLAYFEESDISFAITSNGANYGTHDIALAVLNDVFDKSYELPSFEFVELTSEELDQYVGTYETDELPMDMTISKGDNTLILEVTGQSASPIMAEGNHKFSHMQYGVKIKFVPNEGKMHFEQNGMKFVFTLKETAESDELEESSESTNEDLNKYIGTYASDKLPQDLTISKDGNTLVGRGKGQPSFQLINKGEHKFINKEIGLEVNFSPDEKKLFFIQGSAKFEMELVQSPDSDEQDDLDLNQYIGVYSSDKLPIDITFSKKGNTLISEATGQSSFPLKHEGNHVFTRKESGIKITFTPSQKKMLLEQSGAKFEMTLKQ